MATILIARGLNSVTTEELPHDVTDRFSPTYEWRLKKVGVTRIRVLTDVFADITTGLPQTIVSLRIWKGKRSTHAVVRLRTDNSRGNPLEYAFLELYNIMYLIASEDKEGIKKIEG